MREFDAESSCRQNLNGNRTDPFFSTHDMSDLHCIIVDYDRTVIRRKSVRFEKHCIFHLRCLEFDSSANDVLKYHHFSFRHFETDRVFLSVRDAFSCLFERKMTTMSVISRRQSEIFLLLSEV